MTNILIIYDTRSGNTEEMAKHVAEGARELEYTDVRVKKVDKAKTSDIEWCDGIAVGTPTHCGLISWKLKRFFDEDVVDVWGEIDGKIGTAFSTSRGLGGGNELASTSVLNVLINCGLLVFGLTDYVDEDVTGHYGAVAVGRAGKPEKKICRKLGRRLSEYTREKFG